MMRSVRTCLGSLLLSVVSMVLVAPLVSATPILGGTDPTYRPRTPMRHYTRAADGVTSPMDERLALSNGDATIEFWLEPSWASGGSNSQPPIYAVLSNLAWAMVRPPAVVRDTTRHDGPPSPADRKKLRARPVYSPKYAIYLDNKTVYLQVGNVLTAAELFEATAAKMRGRERIYFVFACDDRGVTVYADGKICAEFPDIRLAPAAGAPRVPQGASVLFGGIPPLDSLQTVRYMQEGDSEPIDTAMVLASRLRPFQGDLGGLRIWTRRYSESQFCPTTDRDAPMLQRGPNEIQRSIAFPDPNGDGRQPKYAQLVAFSDFSQEDPKQHRILLQYPVSGHWVDSNRHAIAPAAVPPPGADDVYGNADDYTLYSVVPSNDPMYLYLYANAEYIGLLYRGPDGANWRFTVQSDIPPVGSGDDLQVSLDPERDELTLSGSAQGLAPFKVGDRSSVTLARPDLGWTGRAINAANGFFTAGLVKYYRTCLSTFDVTSPNFSVLHFQEGKTGTTRQVFTEPDPSGEMRFDPNAGGKVVPFGFRYVGIDQGKGKFESKLVTSEAQSSVENSMHFGVSAEIAGNGPNFSFNFEQTDKSQQTSSSRETNAFTVAKSYNRDFMLALNKSEVRLSPDFVNAVNALRASAADPASLNRACDQFIANWGTHYPLAMTFGALLVYGKHHSEKELKQGSMTGRQWDTEVKAGFAASDQLLGIDNKYSIGGKGGQSSTTNTSSGTTNQDDASFYEHVPSAGSVASAESGPSFSYTESVPLFPDLRPLSDLLSPAYFVDPVIYHEVRAALRERTKAYIESHAVALPPPSTEPWIETVLSVWQGTAAIHDSGHDLGYADPGPMYADVDGDGKADLITFRGDPNMPTITAYRNTGTGFEPNAFLSQGGFPLGTAPLQAKFADLDGDGKADLITFLGVLSEAEKDPKVALSFFLAGKTKELGMAHPKIVAYRSTGAGFETQAFLDARDMDLGYRDAPGPAFADLDGDGKADLITYRGDPNNPGIVAYRCLGTSFDPNAFVNDTGHDLGYRREQGVFYADLNGDHKADLITFRGAKDSPGITAYLGTGNGFESSPYLTDNGHDLGCRPSPGPRFADLDGDGNADLITYRGKQDQPEIQAYLAPSKLAGATPMGGGRFSIPRPVDLSYQEYQKARQAGVDRPVRPRPEIAAQGRVERP